MPIEKVVSGGQTGVDRAALDVAAEYGLACGGWCPRGRKAEDGPIPSSYPLRETPSGTYAQRTEWNVRDSDATLILTMGEPTGGTELTRSLAEELGKPCLIVDLHQEFAADEPADGDRPSRSAGSVDQDAAPLKRVQRVRLRTNAFQDWVNRHGVRVLNVAGPRQSTEPGVYDLAVALLRRMLDDGRES